MAALTQLVTRAKALEMGASRYFTGVPCKKGHVAERAAVNATCIQCKRAADQRQYQANPQKHIDRAAAWALANPESVKRSSAKANAGRAEYRKAYYNANAEQRRLYSREWYRLNREKAYATRRAYIAANPDRDLAFKRNRRARVRLAEGFHTGADVTRIMAAQRSRCAACKKGVANGYHVDHIIPLVSGGSNWPHNLQILCASCNLRKNRKHPIQWQQERGFLI